jgi:hypothetical protein
MRVQVNSERALALLFAVVAGVMVAQSFTFGPTAGRFPRLTGGVVLVGSLLLLFQDYLPSSLRTFVAEDTKLIRTPETVTEISGDDSDGSAADQKDPATSDWETNDGRPLDPSTFTGAIIGLYLLASFLFGMLWVSPVFIVAYSRWFRQPWPLSILLAVLGFGVAYGFQSVLNTPVDEGILFSFSLLLGGL